jgi:hypothetical protein
MFGGESMLSAVGVRAAAAVSKMCCPQAKNQITTAED